MAVYRIYVEKKPEHAVEARGLLHEIRTLLGITSVTDLRILNRYDVEGVDEALMRRCTPVVFAEPQLDVTYNQIPAGADVVFATEFLPGQFDQRADSAAQCIQLISQGERPAVAYARVYLLNGSPTAAEVARIEEYVINPVESRKAALAPRDTLHTEYPQPPMVETLAGFCALDRQGLSDFSARWGLAMDLDDIAFCQEYFRSEGREPTATEIRMIDTYWSDHCRHTTFGTVLDTVTITDPVVKAAYDEYLNLRKEVHGGKYKPMCLMDLGTIGGKYLKKTGRLKNLDESDEINACSVRITVDNNGTDEPWLLLFKNETHNHPTEIEPFGGAATCIGGAIRDPLANRGYVYQAMRLTGAGNPLTPVADTLPGKLPQRKLVTTAAAGYSSYGNQIGLATGQVDEWYHPGYVAKRMEIGAVVGAVPEAAVRREAPAPGDIVILLGGRTGRDGCGGATGSSKAHKRESLATCGAEVQKGNAPEERKLQRLFRNPAATRLIKKCNDFGAGGVSVAFGELADGLVIDLNAVPKKYEGLDGTELAISESQERMAVVVSGADRDAFIALANDENLEATPVAVVTEKPRLVMRWNGKTVCDIAREFLSSNGAKKHADAQIGPAKVASPVRPGEGFAEQFANLMADLNVCSRKGLSERFDATIGAGTVLMPFGGKTQSSPIQAMVAKLPVLSGETKTCSGMAWGFNPFLSAQSPFHGAWLAVAESVSKLVAAGFDAEKAYLTFQEYFPRLGTDPARWGMPTAALLGALDAQVNLGVGAIGGKDSMSGTFEKIDVPPTLVSFAVAAGNTDNVIGTEFRLPGSRVVWLRPVYEADGVRPKARSLKALWQQVAGLIAAGKVLSAWTPGYGGAAEGLFKMGLGNRLGVRIDGEFLQNQGLDSLLSYAYGSFLLELAGGEEALPAGAVLVGETSTRYELRAADVVIHLDEVRAAYEDKLESVLPYHSVDQGEGPVETVTYRANEATRKAPAAGIARPRVLIPVFPGTNCEYDSARAMARAGAEPEILVIKNLTPAAVAESAAALVRRLDASQMLFLPGGFSGGDEPEGSAKLIAAFLRNPAVADAVRRLLSRRDGLVLGICNGFQALVKLGLVPFGDIVDTDEDCPTLTFNTIGRHQSMLVRTRISSNLSPWLSAMQPGDIHTVAVSHGEGRFTAPMDVLRRLAADGQIAAQYVDLDGNPTMDVRYNPNGSLLAVEAVTSPDGRVLGKMGHSERSGDNLYKNVEGNKLQDIFRGGVDYFRL